MIVHDCTRLVEVASFIQETRPEANSGWFLDYFMRKRRTRAEKLEFRKYITGSYMPLLYSGACLPPNLIEKPNESISVAEMTFPVIKAEGKITGCDVDERRILPDGTVIPVGRQRFDEALNWEMKAIIEGLRSTHIHEAITLLKTGGYILHSDRDDGNMGVLDFGRADELKYIDLSGTDEGWERVCTKPIKTIESIMRHMAKYSGISGAVDIVYSQTAWEAMEAHDERESIKYQNNPLFGGFDATVFANYNDTQFMGSTNGGKLRHWVTNAQYIDHTGQLVDVLEQGEILIVSKAAFDAQRVFRTITADNREELPAGADFFLYDDLEEEYNRKCRSFAPWIEEYHLNIPSNVNGAALVRVVPEDFQACVACEECPEEAAV